MINQEGFYKLDAEKIYNICRESIETSRKAQDLSLQLLLEVNELKEKLKKHEGAMNEK